MNDLVSLLFCLKCLLSNRFSTFILRRVLIGSRSEVIRQDIEEDWGEDAPEMSFAEVDATALAQVPDRTRTPWGSAAAPSWHHSLHS